MSKRGRPKNAEEYIPQIKYSTSYKDNNGDEYIWYYDKNISNNGPISIELFSPKYSWSEKLLRELDILNNKYIPKKGQRKLRVTKEDKKRIEEIEIDLIEYHYNLFPEDRVIPKKPRKNARTK